MASGEPFVPNEHFFQTVAVAQQLMAQRAEAEEVSVIFFQAIFIDDVLWSGADILSVTVDSNYTVGDALFKLLREQGPYKVTGVTPFKVVKIMEFTLTDRKEVDPDSRVHRGQSLRAWLVEIDEEEEKGDDEEKSDDEDRQWMQVYDVKPGVEVFMYADPSVSPNPVIYRGTLYTTFGGGPEGGLMQVSWHADHVANPAPLLFIKRSWGTRYTVQEKIKVGRIAKRGSEETYDLEVKIDSDAPGDSDDKEA